MARELHDAVSQQLFCSFYVNERPWIK
ncbi:hypothetical protein [Natranaerobius thermophilus]